MRHECFVCALMVSMFLVAFPMAGGRCTTAEIPLLQRFFAQDGPGPTDYRALRHLEARNDRWDKTASMDVWTDADASGFRYQIVAESGAGSIRSRVFKPALEAEQQMWASGAPERNTISPENYTFEECGASDSSGLARVGVKPRRKDVLLIEGSIFLRPLDAELVRVEGMLSKTPSFWTRHVEIARYYERIAGVRMPVVLETTAGVLLAGKSTFKMTYAYETVNGQAVGRPEQPAAIAVGR